MNTLINTRSGINKRSNVRMATGGSGKRPDRSTKKSDEPGIGTVLAAGAAAAGIAALLYGAKKLYEYATDEKPKSMPEDHDASYQPPQGNSSGTAHNDVPRRATVPKVLSPQTAPRTSLADQLTSYYSEYVKVPQTQTERVQQLVDDIKKQLVECLAENYPEVYVSSQCTLEDVQVVTIDEVDLQVTINLSQESWQLVEHSPTYYFIERKDSVSGDSTYDNCMTNGHLSPSQVISQFMKSLSREFCMNTPDYQARPSCCGSTIVIDVDYDATKSLTINLIPAVCLEGMIVLGRHIPSISEPDTWQESFVLRENQKLRSMDTATCCHLECLKIMKAIMLNHPAKFGGLPAGVYKTLLLQMMEDTPEEDLWRHQCLQEQFVDMLNQLVFCLQSRKLPHYHNRQLNLLSGIESETCDALVNFILNRIGKEKLQTLLIREYKPRGLNYVI